MEADNGGGQTAKMLPGKSVCADRFVRTLRGVVIIGWTITLAWRPSAIAGTFGGDEELILPRITHPRLCVQKRRALCAGAMCSRRRLACLGIAEGRRSAPARLHAELLSATLSPERHTACASHAILVGDAPPVGSGALWRQAASVSLAASPAACTRATLPRGERAGRGETAATLLRQGGKRRMRAKRSR